MYFIYVVICNKSIIHFFFKSLYYLIFVLARCKPKAATGECRARVERYAYNVKTGSCEQFIYGGCRMGIDKNNYNNFGTLAECEETCMCKSIKIIHSISIFFFNIIILLFVAEFINEIFSRTFIIEVVTSF